MPVELHCHSTASDGELAPAQLVVRAQAQGITTLALTDHDTGAAAEFFYGLVRSAEAAS